MMVQIPDDLLYELRSSVAISGAIRKTQNGAEPYGSSGGTQMCSVFCFWLWPGWADDKAKDEETLKNANKVLSDMLTGNAVPAEVLVRANCIVVLLSVKKFGLGVAGTPAVDRSAAGGKEFSGKNILEMTRGRRIGYPFDLYLAIHNSPAGPWKQIFEMSKRQTIPLCSDCFSSHFWCLLILTVNCG